MSAVKTVETAYFRNHGGCYYYAMLYVWKKKTVIKQRDVMSIIDQFFAETPYGKSPRKNCFLSLIHFVALDQVPKIKIFHMVASGHPEVIEGRF